MRFLAVGEAGPLDDEVGERVIISSADAVVVVVNIY